ncbi:glutamate-rich protein 1 [Myxocyprinus asiaticus]|uniref:glutamate-rich protein 1 n=1 Tax=Myxocyprinus asiaticus TaxID=70543 RepID=UPI002222E7AF|nr:glutamate-rich protein 1 [Myxocyprinus asiaticus]
MSLRKEVFQSKVLQRLYPAAQCQSTLQPKAEERIPLPPAERLESILHKESGVKKSSAVQGKKLYTVLPPPEGYLITGGDESVTPYNPDPIDSEDSTADTDDHELHKTRRKRRKKKKLSTITTITDTGEISTSRAEGAVQGQTDAADPNDEGNTVSSVCPEDNERISKNRKRKMKKKRHKEKLLTLGLVPRARALEFTYREDNEEEGVEGNSVGVLNFLRTTQEIYLSDRSCVASDPSLCLTAVQSLFSRLSGGMLPPAEISRLCRLWALLRKDKEQLILQLQEFRDTSTLPADEVSVVCILFKYWLTEILPMQKEPRI